MEYGSLLQAACMRQHFHSAGTDPGVKWDLHWKDGVIYYFKS